VRGSAASFWCVAGVTVSELKNVVTVIRPDKRAPLRSIALLSMPVNGSRLGPPPISWTC
jgi:hypothetical protein